MSIDKLDRERAHFRGPRPIMLSSTTHDDLCILLAGAATADKTAIEFGAHQCIIVRDQAAKDELPEQFDGALVLTVFESKGLEFDDVVIYNFFADSLAGKEWRIVTQYLIEIDAVEEDSLEKHRPLEFDHRHHVILSEELKHLYTAITRARVRVAFFDSNRSKRAPMWHFMQQQGLVQPIHDLTRAQTDQSEGADNEGFYKFAIKSTPEEWQKRGLGLLHSGQFGLAAQCFLKSGEFEQANNAQGHHLYKKAETENSGRAKQALMLRAAECWMEGHEHERAARCLYKAKSFDAAGRLFESIGQPNRAANSFLKVKKYLAAGEILASSGLFDKALLCWGRAQLYDRCVQLLSEPASSQMLCRSEQLDYYKSLSARHHYKSGRFEEAREVALTFAKSEDRIKFFRNHRHHTFRVNLMEELSRQGQHREVAAMLVCDGDMLQAAEHLHNAADAPAADTLQAQDWCREAAKYYHSYVMNGSPHFHFMKGAQGTADDFDLLKRALSLASGDQEETGRIELSMGKLSNSSDLISQALQTWDRLENVFGKAVCMDNLAQALSIGMRNSWDKHFEMLTECLELWHAVADAACVAAARRVRDLDPIISDAIRFLSLEYRTTDQKLVVTRTNVQYIALENQDRAATASMARVWPQDDKTMELPLRPADVHQLLARYSCTRFLHYCRLMQAALHHKLEQSVTNTASHTAFRLRQLDVNQNLFSICGWHGCQDDAPFWGEYAPDNCLDVGFELPYGVPLLCKCGTIFPTQNDLVEHVGSCGLPHRFDLKESLIGYQNTCSAAYLHETCDVNAPLALLTKSHKIDAPQSVVESLKRFLQSEWESATLETQLTDFEFAMKMTKLGRIVDDLPALGKMIRKASSQVSNLRMHLDKLDSEQKKEHKKQTLRNKRDPRMRVLDTGGESASQVVFRIENDAKAGDFMTAISSCAHALAQLRPGLLSGFSPIPEFHYLETLATISLTCLATWNHLTNEMSPGGVLVPSTWVSSLFLPTDKSVRYTGSFSTSCGILRKRVAKHRWHGLFPKDKDQQQRKIQEASSALTHCLHRLKENGFFARLNSKPTMYARYQVLLAWIVLNQIASRIDLSPTISWHPIYMLVQTQPEESDIRELCTIDGRLCFPKLIDFVPACETLLNELHTTETQLVQHGQIINGPHKGAEVQVLEPLDTSADRLTTRVLKLPPKVGRYRKSSVLKVGKTASFEAKDIRVAEVTEQTTRIIIVEMTSLEKSWNKQKLGTCAVTAQESDLVFDEQQLEQQVPEADFDIVHASATGDAPALDEESLHQAAATIQSCWMRRYSRKVEVATQLQRWYRHHWHRRCHNDDDRSEIAARFDRIHLVSFYGADRLCEVCGYDVQQCFEAPGKVFDGREFSHKDCVKAFNGFKYVYTTLVCPVISRLLKCDKAIEDILASANELNAEVSLRGEQCTERMEVVRSNILDDIGKIESSRSWHQHSELIRICHEFAVPACEDAEEWLTALLNQQADVDNAQNPELEYESDTQDQIQLPKPKPKVKRHSKGKAGRARSKRRQ